MARLQKLATSPTALLNTSPVALFKSVDDNFALVEDAIRAGDDCVVVASTSPEQYNALCRERDAGGRNFRLFYLGTQTRILIITVPTAAHEGMHYLLSAQLTGQIAQMGLTMSCSPSAAATRNNLLAYCRRDSSANAEEMYEEVKNMARTELRDFERKTFGKREERADPKGNKSGEKSNDSKTPTDNKMKACLHCEKTGYTVDKC